jgi:hypothetical protein
VRPDNRLPGDILHPESEAPEPIIIGGEGLPDRHRAARDFDTHNL